MPGHAGNLDLSRYAQIPPGMDINRIDIKIDAVFRFKYQRCFGGFLRNERKHRFDVQQHFKVIGSFHLTAEAVGTDIHHIDDTVTVFKRMCPDGGAV